MAQIRSKQIADFLQTVDFANLTDATKIASGLAVKNYISDQIVAVSGNTDDLAASVDSLEVHLSAEIYDARLYTSDEMLRAQTEEAALSASVDSLEVALSAEIVATNSDVTRIDANVSTEKGRIDAILLAANADTDTFVEVVSLINAVDLTNDDALAAVILDLNAEISATNSDFVRVEGALSAEISATNADVTSIDTRLGNVSGNLVDSVDSLELALSAEISATNADFVSVDSALSAEISLARFNENGLAADISTEKVRAEGVELSLSAEIVAEYDRAFAAEEVLADDLSTLSTEVVNEVASIDNRLGEVSGDLVDSVDSLELALTAEISATDADFTSVNTRVSTDEAALATEIVRAGSVETVLDGKISTEKGRIDAILLAADADKDTFVEIVSLINAVDLTNDDALAAVILDLNAEISATNSDFVRVEAALSAEISATNADVTSIDTRLGSVSGNLVDSVDSLELALSAEISATDADFTSLEAVVSAADSVETARAIAAEGSLETSIGSLETAHDSRITSLEDYIMEDVQMVVKEIVGAGLSYTLDFAVQDNNKDLVNAFVNGHRVSVASTTGTAIVLSTPGYTIDEDDTVVFVYQK